MPLENLQKLRLKYPQYNDIPDKELAQKVIAKYPQYQDVLGDIASGISASSPDKPVQEKPSLGDLAIPAMKEVYKSTLGVPLESLSNVPSNAVEMGKSIGSAIVHPIDTAKAIGNVALGGAEKLVPGQQSSEPAFDAFAKSLKDKYGSMENVLNTIKKKPVEFLADASAILGGSGALAKAGGLAKTGEALSELGSITEPIGIAGRTAKRMVKTAGNVGAEALGITTGVGSTAVKEAFLNPNEAMTNAMRGVTKEANIVEDAKSALQDLKQIRRDEYVKQLPKAVDNPIKFDSEIGQLKSDLAKEIDNFKIKVNDDGSLDFSRSPVSKEGQGIIEEAVNKIRDWGSQPGDFSVEGLDTLKRQLGDLIPKTGEAKAFVQSIKSKVRNVLVDNVPEYKKLVADYEDISNTIKDIESGLSLTGRAGAETVMRKLNQALKQNFEFRKAMIDKLDEVGGNQIVSQLAGNQLSSIAPRGLARLASEGAAISGAYAAAKGIINPTYFGFLALSSPRLVGETLSLLGLPASKVAKTVNYIANKATPGVRQTIGQVSNIKKSQ